MEVVVTNLTKTFGSLRANDSISLRFAAGQIHGVLGENGAGKSTLMKLLSGFLKRDGGSISLDGQVVELDTPAEALRAGIGMVHQDPLDVPAFTALENIYFGSQRHQLPSLQAARKALLEQSQALAFSIDPDTRISSLSVGQRQQLEIVRLLICGARVLILDEPTTGITAAQSRALFNALRQLAAEGKTVLFVSHKLEEVAEICHTVSVLRAGKVMGEGQMMMPQPQEKLLELMFGTAASSHQKQTLRQRATPQGGWSLSNVSVREGPINLQNISLDFRGGEITGLAGLEGSGQQTLLRLLAGRIRPQSGQIKLNGVDVTNCNSRELLQRGVEYLPADRLHDGLIGSFTLTEHFALLADNHAASDESQANSKQTAQDSKHKLRRLLVDWQSALQAAEQAIAAYRIKATPSSPIVSLSGGNQQRALLALLSNKCQGLLLEQPTRGLDIASAEMVWQQLIARSESGTAVVFASADLDEILEYSDRVIVFFGGKVSAPLERAQLSHSLLGELIGGVGF